MHRLFSERIRASLSWFALTTLVAGVGLIPWCRNHTFVRSFFDYGVVIGGVGRIEEGQRPYVDFITPIQTGWYVFNWIAEKIAGGTFQAMTWSGAASVVLSSLVLMGILTRRWPLLPSAIMACSMICATVTQHTIFWYNPWGVVLMAIVAWAGAAAPVFRRGQVSWHVIIGTAFFLGGINKINMQLLALAIVWGWALRAGLTGRAGWGRVVVTIFLSLIWGMVLPVCAEMAWTGANFGTWWHNVIALPAASRSGTVLAAFSWDFLFTVLHDYYGPMPVRQIGLIGLVLSFLTVGVIIRKTWREGWLERILPLICGVLAVVAGAVLLTTNMDIVYIGLAGWLALLVGLWQGYELPSRGPWFYGVIILPAFLMGVLSWTSAWQGQRSQFGHSSASRAEYVSGEKAGPAFAYFEGTRLPPELFQSLEDIEKWRQSLSEKRRDRIFYGPGSEWAAHIWPALRTPGLPIYVHVGNSLGAAEYARLYAAVLRGEYDEILVSLVLDRWDAKFSGVLTDKYERAPFFSGMFFRYSRLASGGVSGSPSKFLQRFRGNVDSRYLSSPAEYFESEDKRSFLGVTQGRIEMQLKLPTNRLKGEVIVRRTGVDLAQRLAANFAIYAQQDAAIRYERWIGNVELPAGQREVIVPYAIDSSHKPTTFTLEIPQAYAEKVAAGWMNPTITDVGSDSIAPEWLFQTEAPVTTLNDAALAKLLPGAWRPLEAHMRNGRMTEKGLELSPGGEVWIHVQGIVSNFKGFATTGSSTELRRLPAVRVFWYKAGRLEPYAAPTPPRESDGSVFFHGWCAEPGGWLVIAADSNPEVLPAVVHVTDVVQDH